MSKNLTELLDNSHFPKITEKASEEAIAKLQLKLLEIQQGIWHSQSRAIILFEGFDAAGKGGAIKKLMERLDPRGIQVHAISAPSKKDQGKHYLYRFWKNLPAPGSIAVFDRSWYGRVLVERVEELCPTERWKMAYEEINQFEAMLINDGIDLIKIFLAISPEEQLNRLEDRITNSYKHWKLTRDDLKAHKKWGQYVEAVDEMLAKTSPETSPWHLIPANSKPYARKKVFEIITDKLSPHGYWMKNVMDQGIDKERAKALKTIEQYRAKL